LRGRPRPARDRARQHALHGAAGGGLAQGGAHRPREAREIAGRALRRGRALGPLQRAAQPLLEIQLRESRRGQLGQRLARQRRHAGARVLAGEAGQELVQRGGALVDARREGRGVAAARAERLQVLAEALRRRLEAGQDAQRGVTARGRDRIARRGQHAAQGGAGLGRRRGDAARGLAAREHGFGGVEQPLQVGIAREAP
jgi:hypothetical protein